MILLGLGYLGPPNFENAQEVLQGALIIQIILACAGRLLELFFPSHPNLPEKPRTQPKSSKTSQLNITFETHQPRTRKSPRKQLHSLTQTRRPPHIQLNPILLKPLNPPKTITPQQKLDSTLYTTIPDKILDLNERTQEKNNSLV